MRLKSNVFGKYTELEVDLHDIEIEKYPYFKLSYQDSVWSRVLERAKEINGSFDKVIFVGMGGSSMGGKTLSHYYSPFSSKIDFWDSIDPVFIKTKLSQIDSLENVHWVFTSKSGGTLETIEILNGIERLYNDEEKLKKHFTIITEDKDSKLKTYANKYHLKCLDHPLDVGGRFSALTAVGLMPLAVVCPDIFLQLQSEAQSWEVTPDLKEFSKNIIASWSRGEWISVLWPYDERLREFAGWAQQLWAESLGKKLDLNGKPAKPVSMPVYLHGCKDQHSVLQQIVEGQKDKFLIFFENSSRKNEKMSLFDIMRTKTPESLNNKVNHVTISYDSVFDLILSFEYVIIQLGDFLQIDPFDQPGVEDSKILFKQSLSAMGSPQSLFE